MTSMTRIQNIRNKKQSERTLKWNIYYYNKRVLDKHYDGTNPLSEADVEKLEYETSKLQYELEGGRDAYQEWKDRD